MIRKLFSFVIVLLFTTALFQINGQDKNTQEVLKDPAQRQVIMNQIMNNSEYMNEFMNEMMQNNNARNMMMNHMFMTANRDSSFAGYMFNHMKDYDSMWDHMKYMMNGNGNGMMHGGMINYHKDDNH